MTPEQDRANNTLANVWTFLVTLGVAWGVLSMSALLHPVTILFGYMGMGVLVFSVRRWMKDRVLR